MTFVDAVALVVVVVERAGAFTVVAGDPPDVPAPGDVVALVAGPVTAGDVVAADVPVSADPGRPTGPTSRSPEQAASMTAVTSSTRRLPDFPRDAIPTLAVSQKSGPSRVRPALRSRTPPARCRR
jgi:hypothetical protein